MPTSQKKGPSKRGGTVRDISVKKISPANEESFQVHHIDSGSSEGGSMDLPARPLTPSQNMHYEVNDLENEVESALASMDDEGQFDKTTIASEEQEPKDIVRVKFSKFVQLVTSRDCSDVVNANTEEDVIISSNLLTELAGAHDEREEKKIPLVFLVGLAIGVVLTYILIMK